MYKIAICDDYPEECEKLLDLTREFFGHMGLDCEIVSFPGGQSLLDAFNGGSRFDVYILDIIMPGIDGMALAETIRGQDDFCVIAFVTVSADYAVQGYKVRALDYIVKPVSPSSIDALLTRVVKRFSQVGTLTVNIKGKHGIKTLQTAKIVCVESNLHTLIFTMLDGSEERIYARLDEYTGLLTKYNFFLRCHKSCIVNLNYVEELKSDSFRLNNGKIINISRSYRNDCFKKYKKYIFDKVNGSE